MSTGVYTVLSIALSVSILFALPAGSIAGEMGEVVTHFIASLEQDQRRVAGFEFGDQERFNFHYTPRERKGVPLKALTPAQEKLAHALLATALDSRGIRTVESIMFLEQLLWEAENENPIRDPDLYFVSIFGLPGSRSWGWRFEGHHVSLNLTVQNGAVVSATPAFFGSNPATVKGGPHKGLRVLADREDLARSMLLSLDEALQKRAIVDEKAPRDILSGPKRMASIYSPPGILVGEMPLMAKKQLRRLLEAYASQFREELARQIFWSKVEKEGLDHLHFAWAGSTEPGRGHYYRVQGKTFLLEYDNTQNNANHVHSVWRDLENDFGSDPLAEHYQEAHRH